MNISHTKSLFSYFQKEYGLRLSSTKKGIKSEHPAFSLGFTDNPNGQAGTLYYNDRIPKAKQEALRKVGQSYLDAKGNLFVRHEQVLIHIEGKRALPEHLQPKEEIFTKSGMSVVFCLLVIGDDAPKMSQRDLSEVANVSLGAVNKCLKALSQEGYIKSKRLLHIEKLRNLWVLQYASFKNKLVQTLDSYSLPKEQKTEGAGTLFLFGGEDGAEIHTQNLTPEQHTLYALADKVEVMRKLKLRPRQEPQQANLQLLIPFWNHDLLKTYIEGTQTTVPLLLIYADLLQSKEPRNTEVAEHQIKPLLS
ncbi:type IV toxin-antitoxin system AbiEi family antitoxin [Persicobacter psychrovividus]|uniref:MarR family transcriptional regulator n=1 Tax=Persicobacter psychrovividus TaxID=387638 RepID=A0ABN6LHA1_9BACT|nr:hypothetical protein PEPS_47600 [Persicobacter psychrovividus]